MHKDLPCQFHKLPKIVLCLDPPKSDQSKPRVALSPKIWLDGMHSLPAPYGRQLGWEVFLSPFPLLTQLQANFAQSCEEEYATTSCPQQYFPSYQHFSSQGCRELPHSCCKAPFSHFQDSLIEKKKCFATLTVLWGTVTSPGFRPDRWEAKRWTNC